MCVCINIYITAISVVHIPLKLGWEPQKMSQHLPKCPGTLKNKIFFLAPIV